MQSHPLCMQAAIARGSSGHRSATFLKSYALRLLLSLKKLLEKVFKYSNHGFATRQECTSQPSINGTLDIICQIPIFHGQLHWVLCQMIANLNHASQCMVIAKSVQQVKKIAIHEYRIALQLCSQKQILGRAALFPPVLELRVGCLSGSYAPLPIGCCLLQRIWFQA